MPLLRTRDNKTADILRQVVRDYRYTAKPLNIDRPQRPYNKGRTKIITVQLTEDLLSGDEAVADICDDSGVVTTGTVTVVDLPVGITAGMKQASTGYLRVYKGDDGDYRIVATLQCSVPV
jgi:hypothetical protein